MARPRTSFYRGLLIKFDYLSHSNLDEAENASASKKLSVLGGEGEGRGRRGAEGGGGGKTGGAAGHGAIVPPALQRHPPLPSGLLMKRFLPRPPPAPPAHIQLRVTGTISAIESRFCP